MNSSDEGDKVAEFKVEKIYSVLGDETVETMLAVPLNYQLIIRSLGSSGKQAGDGRLGSLINGLSRI